MAQEQAATGNVVPSFSQHTHQEGKPPPETPAFQDPHHQLQGEPPEQQHSSSSEVPQPEHAAHAPARASHGSNGGGKSSSGATAAIVTPDEVLTLGVLALAGLWPGCWSGIAAIIVHKSERLKKSGAVDAPFQRCARSLVDLLLRNPREASLAPETWQHLADAQARLPSELGQVLGLACSLLQRRSLEASDARAKRKRRRAFSSNAGAARSTTVPQLPIPCRPATLAIAIDVVRQHEEQELEETRQRQREVEGSPVPPLLPPSEVLPLLLQQPQLPAPASAPRGAELASPDQLLPAQPQRLSGDSSAEPPHPVYSLDDGLGGTEAEFPVLLPHSASSAPVSPRPAANREANGDHPGPQGSSDLSSPPHAPPEAGYHSNPAAVASETAVAPPASEAIRDATSSILQ
eukprot:g7742.t1